MIKNLIASALITTVCVATAYAVVIAILGLVATIVATAAVDGGVLLALVTTTCVAAASTLAWGCYRTIDHLTD